MPETLTWLCSVCLDTMFWMHTVNQVVVFHASRQCASVSRDWHILSPRGLGVLSWTHCPISTLWWTDKCPHKGLNDSGGFRQVVYIYALHLCNEKKRRKKTSRCTSFKRVTNKCVRSFLNQFQGWVSKGLLKPRGYKKVLTEHLEHHKLNHRRGNKDVSGRGGK